MNIHDEPILTLNPALLVVIVDLKRLVSNKSYIGRACSQKPNIISKTVNSLICQPVEKSFKIDNHWMDVEEISVEASGGMPSFYYAIDEYEGFEAGKFHEVAEVDHMNKHNDGDRMPKS